MKKEEFLSKNQKHINKLERKFSGYDIEITPQKINNFLIQFEQPHMELALKLLENVNYFSNARVTRNIHTLSSLLDTEISIRNNNVYFCSMDVSAGKSTDVIIRKLRYITRMHTKVYDSKFIHLSDLKNWYNDHQRKIIVFVDDFIGSGGTIERLWSILQNWYNPKHKYYIAIIVGYESTINEIQSLIPFKIISALDPLPESEKIFHEDNITFTDTEKNILKQYCRKIDPRKLSRYGYMNTQSLVIFYENAPNNSIPILHSKLNDWEPLFLRL